MVRGRAFAGDFHEVHAYVGKITISRPPAYVTRFRGKSCSFMADVPVRSDC